MAHAWGCLPWELEGASERWLFTMERYLYAKSVGK